MTHLLKQFLGNDHPLFVTNILTLERATGDAGVDVRLLADITERGHSVLRGLDLDPSNTTAVEAYNALNLASKSDTKRQLLHDTDFVLLLFGTDLVSFNLQDIIENAHHQLPFQQRILGHAQRHLRMEIIRRYAEHDRTNNDMVHRLASEIGLKLDKDEGYHDIKDEHHGMPVGDNEEEDLRDIKDDHRSMPKSSIVAIGDIFTDAFIRLRDDTARIDTDEDGSKRLSFPYGSKPAYDHVDIVKSVGPSPNASVSMARLGMDVSLLAWLGDDQAGKESLDHLKEENVGTSLVVTQPNTKSSYWYVLWYQSDRTMLVKSEDYQYEWKSPDEEPEWIYLSYIGENSWPLHEQLVAYLEEHPKVKLVFQPGTFHFKWGVEKLAELYKHTHLIVMNREEAMDVTGKSHDSIKELAIGLHDLGPNIVVITDGPNGSYASYDWKIVTIPNYPDPAPPLDRTGAGDAFASTIVSALALGESMDTALTWAPVNSASVVQKLGAQAGLLKLDELKEWLSKAPDDYKLTEIHE
ncbi:MAG: carbohydrate kinase family protein [Candidatus Saccharimonadales bacterium]